MSNKLKNIFSEEMFNFGGSVKFKDSNAHNEFIKALQIVQNEGRSVEIEGVASLSTEVRDGHMSYPLLEHDNFTNFIIAPSTEKVPFDVETEFGKKTILFNRYQITDSIILETAKNEIVYLKLSFVNKTNKINFAYKTQPHLAKTIYDIVESYSLTLALFNKMFKHNLENQLSEEEQLVIDVKKLFLI